ncbi:GntR family transcriptional regulator [Aeromicrobium sp. Leaf350]|uniref:GntR family transcriptional regulator n=1 Tax=Aeromicrobium sp. Leaf350 TaxID=2876565 RepID=UPI001E2A8289|nr:GntR family transcriptional regulator [Aeromicrobium sp. Leaf350]
MSQPLADRPTLAEAVVEAMRDGIRHRTFVPEQTYSVQQVADLLGVSRSPVREGLLKLEEAGLVQFSRNRGFHVVLPRSRDIAEIFGVRLALEPAAAARVARRADAELLGSIRAAMEALRAAAATGDEATFWRHDRELHRLLLVGGGNPRAASIVAALRSTTALLGPPTSAGPRDLRQIGEEHAPIVAAVLAGDGDGAEAAMAAHLTSTGLLLVAQAEGTAVDHPDVQRIWDDVAG